MKIQQAIRILDYHPYYLKRNQLPDLIAAIKLGIEALKRLQDNRRDPEFDHWTPLPGETPPPDPGDEGEHDTET